MEKYIFLRIAWMKEYKGVTETDIPSGAGSYVEENEDGGEVYNFYPVKDKIFGFSRVQGGKNIRIERLGTTKQAQEINNVTIVFFAKNDVLGGGQYVVGWYKNATLYRSVQNVNKSLRNGYAAYNSVVNIDDAFLVPTMQRTQEVFHIPDDGPGQSNVWYVQEYGNPSFLNNLKKYIANPKAKLPTTPRNKITGTAWQQDVEKRKQVEWAAMETVQEYFEEQNFEVSYRHTENVGWDLEATINNSTLLLEVKGLSGTFGSVELTANEYKNAKQHKRNYRICVVSNALNIAHKKLDIYFYQNGNWVNDNNETIQLSIIETAKFSKI